MHYGGLTFRRRVLQNNFRTTPKKNKDLSFDTHPYGNLAKTDTFVDVKFNNFVKLVFLCKIWQRAAKNLKKRLFLFFYVFFFQK